VFDPNTAYCHCWSFSPGFHGENPGGHDDMMTVQLFVEVDCGGGGGGVCAAAGKHKGKHTQSSKMKHTLSLTKDNWECTRHIVMADSNLQMSLLSLNRQLSSHTRQTQFLETSTFTYKAGREAGVEGKFSFWHEPSNEPLLAVVQEDVEKYRSNTSSLYSVQRMEELHPRPGLQKGVCGRPHRLPNAIAKSRIPMTIHFAVAV
jgi:hypothetical protein